MKLSDVRRQLLSELDASPVATFVADCILKQITGLSQTDILLGEADISQAKAEKCRRTSSQYLSGIPLQYLLGEWEFFGIPFSVGPGVLIPRQDSEVLCERAISELPHNATVADLCAGSGCLGISVAWCRPDITVYSVEYSEEAFSYLSRNRNRYPNLAIYPMLGNVTDSELVRSLPKLDAILCNPPYLTEKELGEIPKDVSFEPREALYGGYDGLDFYRSVPTLWYDRLKPSGRIYFEIGMRQKEAVCALLRKQGYRICDIISDIEQRPRTIVAEKEGL